MTHCLHGGCCPAAPVSTGSSGLEGGGGWISLSAFKRILPPVTFADAAPTFETLGREGTEFVAVNLELLEG